MRKSEAVANIAILAACFPKQEISETTIEAYALGLIDLEARETAIAVRTLQQTCRFFPSVAEIRETVAELRLGAPPPMHAWEQAVTRGAERHPLVGRARQIVGRDSAWRETPSGVLQKSFLAAYAEVRREAMSEIVAPSLADARRLALDAATPTPELPPAEEAPPEKGAVAAAAQEIEEPRLRGLVEKLGRAIDARTNG